MKKYFLCALCLFSLGAVFHKTLLGALAHCVLRYQYQCELAYRSMDWEEGELVFSDLVLFDPSFHIHVEKAYVQFDWKQRGGHIVLDRPRLSLLKMREHVSLDKSNWTLSVNDGTLEWEGLARFSYAQGHLALNWDDSGMDLFFSDKGVEAELREFHIRRLNPLFSEGQIFDGQITGRVVLDENRQLTVASLDVERFAAGIPLASISEMQGSFSYHSDLGGKWELRGMAFAHEQKFPISSTGKAGGNHLWVESEVSFGKEAFCKISGSDVWTFECASLCPAEASFLQAGLALYHPEAALWEFIDGKVYAKVNFCSAFWNVDFEGNHLLLSREGTRFFCEKASGHITQSGGDIRLFDPQYTLHAYGLFNEWKMELSAFSGHFVISGGKEGDRFPLQIEQGSYRGVNFSGKGWCDRYLNLQFCLDGDLLVFNETIPFCAPNISKQEDEWTFDVRLKSPLRDLARIHGGIQGKTPYLHSKSHLLGSNIHFASASPDHLEASVILSQEALLTAVPLFKKWNLKGFAEETNLHLQYMDQGVRFSVHNPLLSFHAERQNSAWNMELLSDLIISAVLQEDGNVQGTGEWKQSKVDFEGKISSALQCDLSLSKIECHLSDFLSEPFRGCLEGQGHVVYNGRLEADFDVNASSLQFKEEALENEGKLHIAYISDRGVQLSGVDLHGFCDCIVDLVEYDRSHWVFKNAHVHLPFRCLPEKVRGIIGDESALECIGNLEFNSDFSSLSCTGQIQPLENVQLVWNEEGCRASFSYLGAPHQFFCKVQDEISGQLILGEEKTPLSIEFTYEDDLKIHSIEGSFSGLEASFRADGKNSLLGSAKINFTELSPCLPREISEVFQEIGMGRGYELKGRLSLDRNLPSFQGHLTGKQLELFGFQFRTLLAQVHLSPTCVHISDVKISDSAGVMKVDHILLDGQPQVPWTLAMDQLQIIDLRPSLLHKPGESLGPMSPLVVRELTLSHFEGLLDDNHTWTAEGELQFINSYKRGETIFDRPANVLNRIVGLDLELLIPVRGRLSFDLKEGAFHLLELTDAFSEADRSQFFLEMDPSPSMDLDGNLKIFIKMKQFVLLKFTEAFLISLEGKLNDPQYHLKKRSLFGLM